MKERKRTPAMNFDFSDEQKQMRDEARKFLTEKCPPKAVREVLDGKAPYDKALWRGRARKGFLRVAVPQEIGGAGAGPLGPLGVAGGKGRGDAPGALSPAPLPPPPSPALAGSPRPEE